MSRVALNQLKDVVKEAVSQSSVADRLADIVLESDQSSEENDFVRIIIELKELDKVDEAAMEQLTTYIERLLSGVDERFPSVRFAAAA